MVTNFMATLMEQYKIDQQKLWNYNTKLMQVRPKRKLSPETIEKLKQRMINLIIAKYGETSFSNTIIRKVKDMDNDKYIKQYLKLKKAIKK